MTLLGEGDRRSIAPVSADPDGAPISQFISGPVSSAGRYLTSLNHQSTNDWLNRTLYIFEICNQSKLLFLAGEFRGRQWTLKNTQTETRNLSFYRSRGRGYSDCSLKHKIKGSCVP